MPAAGFFQEYVRKLGVNDGDELVLPGRSLLFVRNVGHLMTTPATMHLQVMGSKGWARANGWMDTTKVTTCFGAVAVDQ